MDTVLQGLLMAADSTGRCNILESAAKTGSSANRKVCLRGDILPVKNGN